MRKIFENIKSEGYKFGFDTLVVIVGVLIAFALSDWNENRKLRDLEYQMLFSIRNDLVASRTSLEDNISFNKQTLRNYQQIIDHIEKDLPYSNSLDTAFSQITFWSDPYFTKTSYETLKSKGIEIIQNDSIKITITEIYEQYFPYVIGESKGEWEIYQSLVLPFVAKNILYINNETARPNNFNDLKTNDEFHNLMGLKMMIRKYTIQNSEMTKEKINSLIVMIDKELNK